LEDYSLQPVVKESQETPEVELTVVPQNADYTRTIAVAAVLAALSLVLGATAAYIPRIP